MATPAYRLLKGPASFLLRDVDHGWNRIRTLAQQLEEGDSNVHVGVLGTAENEAATADRPSNVDLAVIHEFGSPSRHIPERSWIRSTFDANRARYGLELGRLLDQVLVGKMSVQRALGLMGARMAGDIKLRLLRGEHVPPPLAPETVRRKLAAGIAPTTAVRPLVATGQMARAVTWQVVVSGQESGSGGAGA